MSTNQTAVNINELHGVGALGDNHSIFGELTLNVERIEDLNLDKIIFKIDDFMIPTVHDFKYFANVLDYDFYNYDTKQVIHLVFKIDVDAPNSEEVYYEIGYRLQEDMIEMEEFEVKDMFNNIYNFKVIDFELDFDMESYE